MSAREELQDRRWLDHRGLRAALGCGVPFAVVVAIWSMGPPGSGLHEPPAVFPLFRRDVLAGVVLLIGVQLAWVLVGPRGRVWPRVAAALLSLATVVAGLYAMLFLRIGAGGLLGPSGGFEMLALAAMVLPGLVCMLTFDEARRACRALEAMRPTADPAAARTRA